MVMIVVIYLVLFASTILSAFTCTNGPHSTLEVRLLFLPFSDEEICRTVYGFTKLGHQKSISLVALAML